MEANKLHNSKYPAGLEEVDIARLISSNSEEFEAFLQKENSGIKFIKNVLEFIATNLLVDGALTGFLFSIGVRKVTIYVVVAVLVLVTIWYIFDQIIISRGVSKYVDSIVHKYDKDICLQDLFK